jgi:hypothetical protein
MHNIFSFKFKFKFSKPTLSLEKGAAIMVLKKETNKNEKLI